MGSQLVQYGLARARALEQGAWQPMFDEHQDTKHAAGRTLYSYMSWVRQLNLTRRAVVQQA
jgi:hypothetical protein